uniref:Interleukin 1 receptor associated kinase 1 binding protein 1 n=1 Tax=Capra hircus TaxID=9925 RepID=A0A8C2RIF8_CAPHI
MSLQQTPQSRVFVELLPWADRGRENYLLSGGETLPGLRRPLSSAPAQTPSREVHVSGTAEVSASPDRAQVVVRVSSTKEAAAEAKKSVCRRLDYITQSLRQQGVQSENVTVTKDFKRLENAYHMEAEVCITFTEFGKMQNICNFLVEKLDSSVVISQPQFYHMPGSVDNLRLFKMTSSYYCMLFPIRTQEKGRKRTGRLGCLRPGRGPRFSRSQNRSTANPRRDAATRGPRDSDRLLPSVESLGGS